VREDLVALAADRPLVVLLEDLHWADPASLELLRHLARPIRGLAALLLATYRPGDVAPERPLYSFLPTLVHESRPLRLDLRPLGLDDLRAMVVTRYPLPARDVGRLAGWLQARAEGNPFYAGELLRGLEEEGLLCPSGSTWMLGDLSRAHLPHLLRQVIDGRVIRLGREAYRALSVAAVIGQEVPLSLWSAVSQLGEESLLEVVTLAEPARLLVVTTEGTAIRFVHALIREVLYEGTSTVQRRAWHRRAGEALADLPDPDPDAVAYHLR
jgi:predicted ATPase